MKPRPTPFFSPILKKACGILTCCVIARCASQSVFALTITPYWQTDTAANGTDILHHPSPSGSGVDVVSVSDGSASANTRTSYDITATSGFFKLESVLTMGSDSFFAGDDLFLYFSSATPFQYTLTGSGVGTEPTAGGVHHIAAAIFLPSDPSPIVAVQDQSNGAFPGSVVDFGGSPQTQYGLRGDLSGVLPAGDYALQIQDILFNHLSNSENLSSSSTFSFQVNSVSSVPEANSTLGLLFFSLCGISLVKLRNQTHGAVSDN